MPKRARVQTDAAGIYIQILDRQGNVLKRSRLAASEAQARTWLRNYYRTGAFTLTGKEHDH